MNEIRILAAVSATFLACASARAEDPQPFAPAPVKLEVTPYRERTDAAISLGQLAVEPRIEYGTPIQKTDLIDAPGAGYREKTKTIPLPQVENGIPILTRPRPSFLPSAPAPSSAPRADLPKFVPVVFYANQPEVTAKEGRRVANLLAESKIEFKFAESSLVMLAVPADQAPEAPRILATAIQTEHLKLTLIEWSQKEDRGAVATPESVLTPK